MSQLPNLDPAALQRLQRLGDNAFVCKMIDLFLEYSGQKVVEARAAQVAGNLTSVEKAVHPIKSSAGNVGARRVQELALQIEELARQGHSENLAASITELERAFAAVRPVHEEKRPSPMASSAFGMPAASGQCWRTCASTCRRRGSR